jgi:ubiquinone/menaquinone biosynthesis C-methylase UbiE
MSNDILSQNKQIQIIKNGIDKVISHYDSLIDENNDPTRDPKQLQEYMDKWDGQAFIDELQLSPSKDALEIGVGTGRLVLKVCDKCKSFTGIDISPKTIERAKDNLSEFSNKEFISGDFLVHNFASLFDIIYSSLTFMHIEDKQSAINKVAILLKVGGRFVLSISKSQDRVLDFGNRRVRLFPDNVESMNAYIKNAGLFIEKQFDTEFATIFVAVKN